MTSDDTGRNNDLELKRLDLERYKIRLNFQKYVLGGVFVAIAIALIPPSFQLATAHLESVKPEAERLAKMQAFHDEYIKDFLNTALTQDIETRIRLAQYFSFVSSKLLSKCLNSQVQSPFEKQLQYLWAKLADPGI